MGLYRATGDNKYLAQAPEYGRREPVTPLMGADSARHYQWYPFMNMGALPSCQSGQQPHQQGIHPQHAYGH